MGCPLPLAMGLNNGWRFHHETKVLRLIHEAGKVVIR